MWSVLVVINQKPKNRGGFIDIEFTFLTVTKTLLIFILLLMCSHNTNVLFATPITHFFCTVSRISYVASLISYRILHVIVMLQLMIQELLNMFRLTSLKLMLLI